MGCAGLVTRIATQSTGLQYRFVEFYSLPQASVQALHRDHAVQGSLTLETHWPTSERIREVFFSKHAPDSADAIMLIGGPVPSDNLCRPKLTILRTMPYVSPELSVSRERHPDRGKPVAPEVCVHNTWPCTGNLLRPPVTSCLEADTQNGSMKQP